MKTKKYGLFGLILLLCGMFCGMITAVAAPNDQYTLDLSGTYYYSRIYEMLPMINEERAKVGADPLVLDAELTELAMVRAAECAVDFSHSRPNGSSCFTVGTKVHGENIAAGRTTASATFTLWMNSSGHKANMMNSNFQSIGIGCYSWGGSTYWVQLFSYYSGTAGSQKSNMQAKQAVSIVEGEYGLDFNLNEYLNHTMEPGTQLNLDVCRINPGWPIMYCQFADDSVVWSSSDTSVAHVDSAGKITARSVGNAVITAKPKNGTSEGASFEVYCRASVKNASVSSIAAVTYNGKAHTPAVTVTVNGKQLTAGTDYDISYSSNIKVGTGKVTITGKGYYTGTKTVSFTISPNVTVKLSKTKVTYTGKAQKPSVKVTSGKKTLKKNKDYTVTYKNNKNAGTATVTVKGKGSYKNFQKTLTFTIVPKKTSLSSLKKLGQDGLQAKWKRNTQATGYEIQICTSKKFGSGAVTHKISKNSVTKYSFTGLKRKTNYYVRIRAYKTISGKNLYTGWSSVKKMKTK